MKKILLFIALCGCMNAVQGQNVTTLSGSDSGNVTAGATFASAMYYQPFGITLDSKGNYWLTDQGNNQVIYLQVSNSRVYARSGDPYGGFHDGYSIGQSGGLMAMPAGIVVGPDDAIYIIDYANNAIRMLSPMTNISNAQELTTISGAGPSFGPGGEEGYVESTTGSDARFSYPTGACISKDGKFMFVADQSNMVIRKVSIESSTLGATSLFAGVPGMNDNKDGSLTVANFNYPQSICTDPNNDDIFVSDFYGGIRKISNGQVTTLIGDTLLYLPSGLVRHGNFLYIGNSCNILRYNLVNKTFAVYAGPSDFTDCGYKDGTLIDAKFNGITDLKLNAAKTSLIVVDQFNNRIRQVPLPSTVSVNETGRMTRISAFPNPSNGKFTLSTEDPNVEYSIELFDITGKQVLSQAITFTGYYSTLDLSGYDKGVYILKLSNQASTETLRLILK